MSSTKLRGQKKETMCANELKACGWKILHKSCTVKRGPCYVGLDFGGVGDVVASRKVDGVNYRMVVSCSYHEHRAEKLVEITKAKTEWGLQNEIFELWLWQKARWHGRGKGRHWENANWEKLVI